MLWVLLAGPMFVEEVRVIARAEQMLLLRCCDALRHLDCSLCRPLEQNSHLHPQDLITRHECLCTVRKSSRFVVIGPRPRPSGLTREMPGSLRCTHPGCSVKRLYITMWQLLMVRDITCIGKASH